MGQHVLWDEGLEGAAPLDLDERVSLVLDVRPLGAVDEDSDAALKVAAVYVDSKGGSLSRLS